MHFLKLGIRDEGSQFSQISSNRNMDYHKKMVAAPPQKCKYEDDDDDVEALRFAALQSLRTPAKDPLQNRRPLPHQGRSQSYQGSQSSRPYYNKSRGDHFSHRPPRQNGTRNTYAQKNYRNPNLIEIVPVVEVPAASASKENIDIQKSQSSSDGSKFQRYDDNASGSEEDDVKDIDIKVEIKTEEKESTEKDEVLTDKENESDIEQSPKVRTAEQEEEDRLLNIDDDDDDDDDVLFVADSEEEVSLDRLMDEMEREIKDDKIDVTEKKFSRKEKNELKKVREQKKPKPEVKPKEEPTEETKPEIPVDSKPLPTVVKPESRPVSPRPNFRRRSLSPKPRPWRKTSPRRSPRRSPVRLLKKPLREMPRYRSPPRYSPRSPRLSPRPRSPRMSPRRSPNRSPMRRSPLPLRKLSPRGRSPRLSPRPRSPRMRTRSPRSRSRSPRLLRSPRRLRSRSPRYSPHRYSPRLRSRSPRSRSPRSPRRRLSRSRSPRSPRRGSPRLRSPRMSPRRISPRYRSPRGSPRRSPWSSPRRSPRMSPKRAWSPRWSPKDGPRKSRPKSITPERRGNSPQKKDLPPAESKSPDIAKLKPKRENVNEKPQVEPPKEPEPNPDPVLEARRRKFESQTPIDPINANKKIKLSNKKEESNKPDIKKLEIKKAEVKKIEVKKPEPLEETEEPEIKGRKVSSAAIDYNEQEEDIGLDTSYEFGELEEEIEEEEQEVEATSAEVSLKLEPVSQEKKKKKKKDKEIYQVGKLKGDVPLGERIVKEKKFKKRKVETIVEGTSEAETVFEDTAAVDEEGDLRAELSRRRAERLNRTVPMQSARLLQSAFKGVVNEVAKNNAKVNQRHVIKGDEKPAQKEVRRVTVLHRTLTDFHDSEEETALETNKVPVRLRLGINKTIQETRETKVSRKSSKRQGRKVKHKNNLSVDSQNSL